jgi:hypothetical protein
VLAKLRNRRFFSLDELNVEVRACVATINAKVMKKFAKSRRELLETIDRPALKELPSEPYRYAEWKRCGVSASRARFRQRSVIVSLGQSAIVPGCREANVAGSFPACPSQT